MKRLPRFGPARWISSMAVVLATMAPPSAGAVSQPLALERQGSNGEVLGTTSTDCPIGALEETTNWQASATVPAGVFTPVASSMNIQLKLLTGATGAALNGTDSVVVLRDDVGFVTLTLLSGDCTTPTFAFNGTTVSGSGVWEVVSDTTASNAYRDATGNGRFDIEAEVVPGADDNSWTLRLGGTLDGTSCTIDLRAATTGASIIGTAGDDKICASPFDDTIAGLDGNDQVYAGSGTDWIKGSGGNDAIAAGAGDDTVHARPGIDTADGGAGFDRCTAGTTSYCERGDPG